MSKGRMMLGKPGVCEVVGSPALEDQVFSAQW